MRTSKLFSPDTPARPARRIRHGASRIAAIGLLVAACGSGGGGTPGPTVLANHLLQSGITWNFDGNYVTGRFVNGDWWVKGPVTITSVSPTPSGGRNGSMVNPVPGTQGYDSRINFYDSAVAAEFPLKLKPGSSLVSTVSLGAPDFEGGFKDFRGAKVSASHAYLRTAAVLTVVAEEVPSGTFRPPYAGDAKPLYSTGQLRWDLLPKLRPVSGTPDYADYERGLQRVWLQHIKDWSCRAMHPIENMPNYHRDISLFWSEAALLVMLDKPQSERIDLLIGMVQQGIDQYHVVTLGQGDSAVNKFPVLFAGVMLGVPEIRDVFVRGESKTPFREDWQTYYAGKGSSTIKSSKVSAGVGWTGATVLWRQDPGDNEHEHLHPSEWNLVPNGGGKKREVYRHITTSNTWPGMCLAARLMKLQSFWNHPAYFDYVDRWMTEPFSGYEATIKTYYPTFQSNAGSAGSTFVMNMWKAYR